MKMANDFEVGTQLEITLPPVSRLDLIKYAGASGDFNPIHTIDEEAAKAGLPGIIAHGMWTMGNLSKLFTPYFEEGFLEDYSVAFKGMVFLNDEITLQSSLVSIQNDRYYFDVIAINQNEETVVKGSATLKRYQ
ncbi:MaoC/PaaZ C-terminal domain-containing protein [Guptibacillus hwajinpoensis]|uniref:MaoC/PaaZ C-terminal domain-containing protein n=1 Tax=Guptibacillus hwajinpoensis TaxID=208199 RepID=UPI001CFE2F36|nr:MaoC/PaaZ C-terminal domain-containing protein [Pseudalkalibacillus hwajinpoensis]WLR60035.1 MaoC/PaaZ C-terminal domain-containing protein [Pseudalkalibacillus hwajinpoensis]